MEKTEIFTGSRHESIDGRIWTIGDDLETEYKGSGDGWLVLEADVPMCLVYADVGGTHPPDGPDGQPSSDWVKVVFGSWQAVEVTAGSLKATRR